LILESSYWKDDLLKLATKLERRLIQVRWPERSFYAVEKEVFLGFYSIRKLIESRKISESIANKEYQVYEYPIKNKKESLFVSEPTNDFELDKSKKVSITMQKLCNQFIHSYYFAPFIPDGKSLIGFFISSDYKRKTGIYLITIFDVVDIYRQIGNNYPAKFVRSRTESGKILTHVE